MDYAAIMQEMGPSFVNGESYTLTPLELEIVYLALVRLADLERFGTARDWKAIRAYCPRLPGIHYNIESPAA
jgi:hypothetical protein